MMKIRAYQNSDKEAVLNLLNLNTPIFFANEEKPGFEEYLNNQSRYYYVVEVDGIVVGSGGFNLFDDLELVRISWDMVHPLYQGKGLGKALLLYRINIIKDLDDIKYLVVRT